MFGTYLGSGTYTRLQYLFYSVNERTNLMKYTVSTTRYYCNTIHSEVESCDPSKKMTETSVVDGTTLSGNSPGTSFPDVTGHHRLSQGSVIGCSFVSRVIRSKFLI